MSEQYSPDEMVPLNNGEASWDYPEKVLAPKEWVQIDLTSPIIKKEDGPEVTGLYADHNAVIYAGGKAFLIIKPEDADFNADFLLIDETFSKEKKKGFKGIREDKPITIGRAHYKDRFEYPDTISGDHFEVFYKESRLLIHNLQPTNKTVVAAHLVEDQLRAEPHHIIIDSKTKQVEDRVGMSPNFGEGDEIAPYGYYMNHPILGRKSVSVDGGVYLGGSSREAIVVDGKSSVLKQVYKDFITELRESFAQNETLPIRGILLKTLNKVKETMPYNAQKTGEISKEHYGDKLVGLSTYVKENTGVCRHQGLLAAYLIENLINDNFINGKVGVERNTVEDLGGSHAWAIYKPESSILSEPVVIDPAQNFVGTKRQARRENRWEYNLSTDDY